MDTHTTVETVQPDSDLPDYLFYKFDSLQPGNGFIIHEDNDPYSIYSKMLEEKGDSLSWEYLTVGPKKWCIKISKKDNDHLNETLGEMAVADHRKALILRKYGLDFSFKGDKTLKEACAEIAISTKNVERELSVSGQQSLIYTVNYNNLELDYLADFIVTNHHQYTGNILQKIAGAFTKNSTVIYNDHFNLLPLVEVFNQLHSTINVIMQEEEQVLFPYIRFLVQVTKGKINAITLPAYPIGEHIRKIEKAHHKIGEQIKYISNFTCDYTMPHFEHSFITRILEWLNEFASDLYQHIHIEKNILFRKVLTLEKEYFINLQPADTTHCKTNAPNDHLLSLL